MPRIDDGPPRPGRRPGASIDFPVRLHVADDPTRFILEVDGQQVGPCRKVEFSVELDAATGLAVQKLTIHLYDRESTPVNAAMVDRLHEMTDHNPNFELDIDIVDWPAPNQKEPDSAAGPPLLS